MAKKTKEDEALLGALLALGGDRQKDDSIIYSGDKFILPEKYASRPIDDVTNFLERWDAENNNHVAVSRKFDYHPFDVANAFQETLKAVFGSTGLARGHESFFGSTPPEYKTVKTSRYDTIQVPWGRVEMPVIEANFEVSAAPDRNRLPIGSLEAVLPKKYRSHVEGFFKAVEEHLKQHSIYRGKAIDANWMDPEFLDLSTVQPEKVIYNEDTLRQLDANILSILRNTERVQQLGLPLKRAILLEGPYGTGKSLTGYLTALEATDNGWTFVYAKPNQDINQALHSARLLAPAVVFFEDLDVIAKPGGSDDAVSKLLDSFDGISNKNTPVMAVLTTNHVERLHKGMLRPGRLDAVVHIGELDGDAIRRMILSILPPHSVDVDDWIAVAEAMHGFLPAFVKESTDRALRYAVARTVSDDDIKITSKDLVDSANGLRPQLDLMTGAKESVTPDPLSKAFSQVIQATTKEVVANTGLTELDEGAEQARLKLVDLS